MFQAALAMQFNPRVDTFDQAHALSSASTPPKEGVHENPARMQTSISTSSSFSDVRGALPAASVPDVELPTTSTKPSVAPLHAGKIQLKHIEAVGVEVS